MDYEKIKEKLLEIQEIMSEINDFKNKPTSKLIKML